MTCGPGPLATSADALQVELGWGLVGVHGVPGSVGASTSASATDASPAATAASLASVEPSSAIGDVPTTGGDHGASGTMAHMTRYTITNAPPVKIASRSHRTRAIDGSMSKYSAVPAATPPIFRSVGDRYRRRFMSSLLQG
jgi:hypothetical protein